jgi:hypothetical protein
MLPAVLRPLLPNAIKSYFTGENLMKLISAVLTFAVLAVLLVTPAHAQATRTWVSGVGDDANPCSRTAPCKTFAGAISKTAAAGEISVLDPGGFGAVTITKSITINGDGTLAGILSAGTNGIIINAGVNDKIIIRNISINGAGTGINGIRFLAGKQLTVDNVTITGITGRGIDVSLTATGASVIVNNTRITNAGTGIFLSTTVGNVLGMVDHVQLTGLTNGLEAFTGGRANVSNSVISGNSSNGVLASGANSFINLNNSQITFNNLVGVNASVAGSTIRISNNDIANNTAGISIAGSATVSSAVNNRVVGNVGTTAPNGTAIPIQ